MSATADPTSLHRKEILLPTVTISSPLPDSKPLSIVDFLTDGSLAALCAELSKLTGVTTQLRDAAGRVISRNDQSPTPWTVSDAPLGREQLDAQGFTIVPLILGDQTIGMLTLAPGQPKLSTESRHALERTLQFLAKTSAEICGHDVELRHRIKEVGALYRVSSLLVRAAGPEKVLEVALESVIDALNLDAGSIMLLKDDEGVMSEREEDLVLKSSRKLTRDWLECPTPLSKDRQFDRMALQGQIVVSEDMQNDPRIQIPDRAAAEGLRAAIHAGLVFQDRPIGVIRLYSRTPRIFTDSDRRLLRSIAQQAAVAVEQSRLLNIEREEQRIQRQLQLATDVQRRMLPSGAPSIKGLDIAAKYVPSFELGGDFYDFIELNGHFGIAVGDVVGKGIAAALLMASVRSSLRAYVQDLYDLDEVVQRVNTALCRDTRDNEFSSLWYGVIDPNTLRMTYCSAGHEPTIVVRVPKHRAPSPADMEELGVGGMVVGIDPSQRYQRSIYDLKPRDFLIAYTDGLVDANNFAKQRFGKKRLRETILKALGENPDQSAHELLERIHWEVRQFAGLSPRPDDHTTVVVKVLDITKK